MKKTGLFITLIVIVTLAAVSTVSAADDNWKPFEDPANPGSTMECTVVEPIGPNAKVAETLPAISAEDWSIGPEDAPLTILEYADFQCPYCSTAGLALAEFQKKHPEEVRYVYRHFPLSFHEKAPMAAYAADAAGKQGLFFDAEHLLYEKQFEWSALPSLDAFDNWLKEQFKENLAGLDYDQWLKDYADADLRKNVDGKFDEVVKLGIVNGTPTIFLNLNQYQGNLDEASLLKFLELFKLQSKLYQECPPQLLDPGKQYRAIIDTTKGQIIIDLFADKAPLAVNSFIFLSQEGWFDDTAFHRFVKGFVAQAGDPSGTGMGSPGFQFADETHELKYGEPGMVGMANSGPGKNGSQFFITYNLHDYYLESIKQANETASADKKLTDEMIETQVQAQLDKMSENYTIFGKVSQGMDVAEALTAGEKILSIKIEEQNQ